MHLSKNLTANWESAIITGLGKDAKFEKKKKKKSDTGNICSKKIQES